VTGRIALGGEAFFLFGDRGMWRMPVAYGAKLNLTVETDKIQYMLIIHIIYKHEHDETYA
jgi:hypothetical protein